MDFGEFIFLYHLFHLLQLQTNLFDYLVATTFAEIILYECEGISKICKLWIYQVSKF
jgi:hypothetical protein